MRVPNWVGDLPTWFATCAAIYAGARANSIVKIEQARDDQLQFNAQRAQAAVVACWLEPEFAAPKGRIAPSARLIIQNGSDLPIYKVDALIHLPDDSEQQRVLRVVLPPKERHEERLCLTFFEANLRSEGLERESLSGELARDVATRGIERIAVRLEFSDAFGRRWLRRLESLDMLHAPDASHPREL